MGLVKESVETLVVKQINTSLFLQEDYSNQPQQTQVCWKERVPTNRLLSEEIYTQLEQDILDNYKDMNIIDQLFEL